MNIELLCNWETYRSSSLGGTSSGHGKCEQGSSWYHLGSWCSQSAGSGTWGWCQPPGHGRASHWHRRHGSGGRDQGPSPVAGQWSRCQIHHQRVREVQGVRELQEVPISESKPNMVGLKYRFGLLGAQSCRKGKNHPQLVQFLHCDHGVQEVQWVQEVRSYHPYQQVQKIQQGPINTKTETSKSSQNELQDIQATVYMLQQLDQIRKIM